MAEKKVLFKSEELKDRTEVATFLRDLAAKLEAGELALRREAEEVRLSLPERVILEIKVEEKAKPGKTKQSLEIEIEWGEGLTGGVELA
ncbi:amphi-Trp domain-containing protein [Thermosulfurimonas marina]|uniref:Amphi-Trp domain-containing protein n=1 Tax=Thermosulfurimonas marina TaxID=2047767 RepID=A0A6H1WQ06_9BACT|nr:amphi-Trp domain-containing protein [Thermosulfurimonas marina]QJA05282.1 amphi-Trp domain-containing protein [Thermosulfurimonas marina]